MKNLENKQWFTTTAGISEVMSQVSVDCTDNFETENQEIVDPSLELQSVALPQLEESVKSPEQLQEYEISEETYSRIGLYDFKNPFLNVTEKYNAIQYFRYVGPETKVKVFKFDVDNETRVYQKRVKELLLKVSQYDQQIKGTTKKAIRNGVNAILIYIIANLEYISPSDMGNDGDNYLIMDLSLTNMKKELGIGKSMYYDCMNFFTKNNIVAKLKHKVYYINPQYFFAGNRMRFLEIHTPHNFEIKTWLEQKSY